MPLCRGSLETPLFQWSRTVLAVSHDRRFLERIATRVVEVRGGEAKSYPGNYSQYLKLKAEDDLAARRAYEKQQEYIQKTEEYIRRYKAGIKSKQARGRQSVLDRVERLEDQNHSRSIGLTSSGKVTESGEIVLTVTDLCKSFGERTILADVNFTIRKGERLALVGPNGSGKTTLLKTVMGEVSAEAGQIRFGSRVKPAYFAQEKTDLSPERTVLEEILYSLDLTVEKARTRLGAVLFTGDDVFKKVKDLSGGEQGRLALLKMTLSGSNFLILDEPTNHLDIESRQAVEDMLTGFDGTILVVSHDRYFLDQIADGVLALESCRIEKYPGNYSYYQIKLAEKKKEASPAGEPKQEKREYRNRVSLEEKEERRKKRELIRSIEAAEQQVEALEQRKSELAECLADPATYNDEQLARDITAAFRNINDELDQAYERWEMLSAEAEQAEHDGEGNSEN